MNAVRRQGHCLRRRPGGHPEDTAASEEQSCLNANGPVAGRAGWSANGRRCGWNSVRFRGHPEGEWLASAHGLAVDHCAKGCLYLLYSTTMRISILQWSRRTRNGATRPGMVACRMPSFAASPSGAMFGQMRSCKGGNHSRRRMGRLNQVDCP